MCLVTEALFIETLEMKHARGNSLSIVHKHIDNNNALFTNVLMARKFSWNIQNECVTEC